MIIMDSLHFGYHLLFLFVSALVGTSLKRRAEIIVLKRLEGSKVILPDLWKIGSMGRCEYLPKGLEIVFRKSKSKIWRIKFISNSPQ